MYEPASIVDHLGRDRWQRRGHPVVAPRHERVAVSSRILVSRIRTASMGLAAALASGLAAAASPLVAELEKRLSTDGVDKLNAYLAVNASPTLISLNRDTAGCEFDAVSLTVRLARGRKSKVVDAHHDSLRTAVGNCPGFVLALLSPPEVPKVCSSIGSWTVMQTVRELRQRIKRIETDESLIGSPRGKACRAAYVHELDTTRVGLRARKP